LAPGEIHYLWYKRSIIISVPLSVLYTIILVPYSAIINPYLFLAFYLINYGLGSIVEPDLDQMGLTSSEGRMLRGSKHVSKIFGFLGAFWVMWWFLYAYVISLVGGHRSKYSHSLFLSTAIRMIWFNIPIILIMFLIKQYYGWDDWYNQFYLDVWLYPYLLGQFLAWSLSDSCHLLLDTEWSKNRLYVPLKNRR